MSEQQSRASVTTVNAEKFSKTVFVRIVVSRPGVTVKIKSMTKLDEYVSKLKEESGGIFKADTLGVVIPSGANAVAATKRIFIKVPADKENGRQVIRDPIDKATKYLSEVKSRLTGRFGVAQPSRIMDGLYVLPESQVGAFQDEIEAAKSKLTLDFIPEIESEYDAMIERAQNSKLADGGLGPLFNRGDYPSAEEFCKAFGIDALWLKLGVPDNLPAELQAQFKADFERRTTEATEEIFTALRVQFAELIEHAADVLKPGEDGKAKKFNTSTLENIKAFSAVFEQRNIFGDAELQTLVEKARALMTGMDTDKIRKSQEVRELAQRKFAEIKTEIDKMIVTVPSRKFNLDED